MATKSSKIAVTLEPELKQKLREYGKENQIKNFSGVILAILDDYFDDSGNRKKGATLDLTSIVSSFESLAQRVSDLEGLSAKGNASTPKPILKSKVSTEGSPTEDTATGKTTTADTATAKLATPVQKAGTKKRTSQNLGTSTSNVSPVASSSKSTSTLRKIRTSSTTAKSSSQAAPTAKTPPKSKSGTGRSIKSKIARTTNRNAPTPISPTSRTTSASVPKAPVNPNAEKAKTTKAKTTRTKPTGKWMSTREAFEMFGGDLSWSRFSKLTPEELKARFNLNSDLSRKVRGSRFNQWLTLD